MSRRLVAGRDMEIARLLVLSAGDRMQEWLAKRVSVEIGVLRHLSREYFMLKPDMARSLPDERATEQAQLAHKAIFEEADLELRAGWLLRHLLTPGTSDCLLDAAEAQRVRNLMLDKLRDRDRRQDPDSLTMRLSGFTAEGIDTLAKARGLDTRNAVLVALVRDALSEELFGSASTNARPEQRQAKSQAKVRNEIAGLTAAWEMRNYWSNGLGEPPTNARTQRRLRRPSAPIASGCR